MHDGMRHLLAVLMALALCQSAVAAEISTVEFAGTKFTVCRVNIAKESLSVFHRDDKGAPLRSFVRLKSWLGSRGRAVTFAMNGGMFHADFSPVGLLVADGKTLSPVDDAEGEDNFYLKPNGVFVVTDTGAAVLETAEYAGRRLKARLATQSGPLLVRGGALHPAFKAGSKNRVVRNGVGVPSRNEAVFVISDGPVNFFDFATLFRDVLHCPDALYLDGSISSLHAPTLSRSDAHAELGPILAVTEPLGAAK